MNYRTAKHSPIALGLAIILTAVLALGFWGMPGEASAADRYIKEHSYEQIFGYEDPDADYCITLYDVKMTTLQRDGYVEKDSKKLSALKKQIIKSAKAEVVTYTEHQATARAKITDVSGLKKVAKKNLGSYDFGVVDVEYQVTDSNTGEMTKVAGQVILILDESEEEPPAGDEEVGDDEGSDVDEGDDGEEASDEDDADKKKEDAAAKKEKEKEKQKKANTGKISKKEDGDDQRTAAITDGGNGSGQGGSGSGTDPLGTGLCIAAALAALFFALSIVPDVQVIRWFNQKKAMKQGGM